MVYIQKYIRKQIIQFRKNFVRSGNLRNQEAIHDFRVALKRLLAISRFVKKHHDLKNVMKIYRISHMERFYKAGGVLREIQINKKILKSYSKELKFSCKVFLNYLKEKEKKAKKQLLHSRNKLHNKKVKKFESVLIKKFNTISHEDLMTSLDDYILSRIVEIESLIKHHHVETKLHRIRKLVKSIKYMMEMTGQKERTYGKLDFSTERITLLEDHIGAWHDLYVFREELMLFMNQLSNKGRHDDELDVLSLAVENNYKILFDETVEWIYNDFKISADNLQTG